MTRAIWLVRHPPVAIAWQKRCYGQSDPGLSREGTGQARTIAAKLAAFSPDLVIHSDLRRTRAIAVHLARRGVPTLADPCWRERHFGDWEAQSWHKVYRKTGSAMEGMMTAPGSYRPGGGETTLELFERIGRAWLTLPSRRRIAIITHGGPIACVRAWMRQLPVEALPQLIPATGEIVRVDLTANPIA